MTRTDSLIVVLAAALLPFLYLGFWGEGGAGESVRIQDAAGRVIELPLARDQRLKVAGRLGESIIEVRGGQVRFVASPCTGKQCIHSGWLHESGEVAACLPNGISAAVAGRDPRFDAVNF
ncbi:MAG TPA: NusG domain II-containing protein [Gammaproteobacteria bacterium]|nr:NusG domain II-containing protein [Gammaproteobacteria bacterium]